MLLLMKVAVEYSAFNTIKDDKRYLTGEGRAGTDNTTDVVLQSMNHIQQRTQK